MSSVDAYQVIFSVFRVNYILYVKGGFLPFIQPIFLLKKVHDKNKYVTADK